VSIGGALAEARSEAGLSITDVSERTRIRAAIIQGIERDDYAACGGDFYARGHIRAIAKVVGTDPVPLIAEYDAARQPHDHLDDLDPGPAAPAGALGAAVDPTPAARRGPMQGSDTKLIRPADDWGQHALPFRAALRARTSGSGPAAGPRLSGPARASAARLAESAQAAADWLAARADRTGRVRRAGRSGRGRRSGLDRPSRDAVARPRLTAALALALLAAIGLAAYLLISGSSGDSRAPKAHSDLPGARHHPATHAGQNGHAAAPGPAGTGAGQPPPAILLTPAGIAAFGPGGTGKSDDPQAAALAIDGDSRTGWHTSWYTTPAFGGLQSGTGLLLDMGQPIAVASARIVFGPAPGGVFQLRAGNSPALANLQPVAQGADPGGAVSVRVGRPVHARYLLVWITRLPPDSAGTCQALIDDITVRGAR
jgi:hypothetical protein